MPEDLKTLYLRYLDEMWSKRDAEALPAFFADDFVNHMDIPGMPGGVEGVKTRMRVVFAAFPDSTYEVLDCLAEGDRVATYLRFQGINSGEFMGMPATGKRIDITSFDITRIVDGKIVEHWELMDVLGMMQQLGLAPTPDAPAQPAATGEIFTVSEDSGDL